MDASPQDAIPYMCIYNNNSARKWNIIQSVSLMDRFLIAWPFEKRGREKWTERPSWICIRLYILLRWLGEKRKLVAQTFIWKMNRKHSILSFIRVCECATLNLPLSSHTEKNLNKLVKDEWIFDSCCSCRRRCCCWCSFSCFFLFLFFCSFNFDRRWTYVFDYYVRMLSHHHLISFGDFFLLHILW